MRRRRAVRGPNRRGQELDASETAQDACIAAVTAGEREFREEFGNPLIENRAVPAGTPPDLLHTRARGAALVSPTCACHQRYTRTMASSPMRKLRKTGALDQEGNLITIPRLPSVTGTNKPPGWNRWSAAEKVEHLLGLSLDRMREYLSWPADDLDPYRLAAQTQVIRVVAMVGAKVGDQARREREGRRTVDELLRKISAEHRSPEIS